jgi:phenylalanyl-tRNA synthetase beta chain
VQEEHWPFLHPGRSASVAARGRGGDSLRLGFLGELHPSVAASWGLERTATFAIDLGKLAAVTPELLEFRAFGSLPPLRQDIAVTLPEHVSAAQVLQTLRSAAGEMLEAAEIFDVYSGSQVGEGRRSLALALSFRAEDRTLSDEDVAPLRERMLGALREIGGELRG